MNRAAMRTLVGLLVLIFTFSLVTAQSTEIYRRAELIETRTGVVDIRVVYSPRLNVPKKCEDGSDGCTEEIQFPRLYALDFALETRATVGKDVRVERIGKGQVYMALQFKTDDQVLFDDELRNHLATLSADVFEMNYARLPRSQPVFSIPERSETPSWSCLRNGTSNFVTKYFREYREGTDGKEGAYSSNTRAWGGRDSDDPFCDEMAAAVDSAFSDTIRTQPVPRKVVELSVRLAETNSIQDEAYVEDLTSLPEGGSLTLKEKPGGHSGGTFHKSMDGSTVHAAIGRNEVEWTSTLQQADIPPDVVQRNAWLTRWELGSVERTFGPKPVDQHLAGSTLTMALLATLPPVRLDENDEPIPPETSVEEVLVQFDEDSFLEELGKQLDKQSDLNPRVLEYLLTEDPPGLVSEGWIMVICRQDGSAVYGVPQTGAMVNLTNADLFCAAVEAELE